MAEESNDIIEESKEDIQNWIYYSDDPKKQESDDLKTFTETDQQLVFIDYNLMDGNEQKFQYDDCNDNSMVSSDMQDNSLQENCNVIEEQAAVTNNSTDDSTEHNIILKETINENGNLVEEYFCQQCNIYFQSIEDFLSAHPSFEVLNENTEEEKVQQSDGQMNATAYETITENKLWDLVENLGDEESDTEEKPIMDIKTNDISSVEQEIPDNSFETDKEHYFCYDCQQVFTDLEIAENHDCKGELQSSNDLIENDSNLIIPDDIVYRCHLCDKNYPSLRSFTNHQRGHKKSANVLGHSKTLREEPTICEICNTTFASEKNLKLHMKMHKKHTVKTIQDALPVGAQEEYNELNQFFCEICNKSFDQNLLGIHKNMHQNLEQYICGKCNKKFENLPSYEIHMQMHGENLNKGKTTKRTNNETSFSAKTSTSSSQLLLDGGKRKHACQYCGKEFLRPYEKVKHERIHTGEKPYECEVCGKTFRVSYSLTLHLRTHTDIRPYVCATCNKRFKQQSVYVHHLKTHDTECAYKCDICGKCFRTSVQLCGHKNIHSKPYNCTECNRPFASMYAVKIHMKTHNKCHKSNKNLKNRCSVCGASYARVFALSLHIKEQHGIDVDPMKLAARNTNSQRKTLTETDLLMHGVQDGVNQELNFINSDDAIEDIESNEVNNEDDEIFTSQIDHGDNLQNTLQNNVYMDETEAATQTILNTEEITVDHFPAEEIITDWLTK